MDLKHIVEVFEKLYNYITRVGWKCKNNLTYNNKIHKLFVQESMRILWLLWSCKNIRVIVVYLD